MMKQYELQIDRLAACREEAGLSRNALSKMIGVSQPAYVRYELGERRPSMQVIREIANVLGTSSEYLTGETDLSRPDIFVVRRDKEPEAFALFERLKKRSPEEQAELIARYIELLDE